MSDPEEFGMNGSIVRHDMTGLDPLEALLGGGADAGGRELPPGQYQIGPYTVTPTDDESGMLEYVVRMQDALMEAVQTLHQKEVKINQLSQQVSQLTEEKGHIKIKLDALTRTVQEKDQRMRKATHEVRDWEGKFTALEKEEPRKASTEAKRQLRESKKEVTDLKKAKKEVETKLKKAEEAKAPLDIKCGVLQEELDTALGRYKSLDEQRQAAQEQVSALSWKLQAFEQQYAALYNQYAVSIRADSPAQEGDIPRAIQDLPEPSKLPFQPPAPPALTTIDISHEAEPLGYSDKTPLVSQSSCSQGQ